MRYITGGDNAGYVNDRMSADARIDEIDKWTGHEWHPILTKLDADIAKIVPEYNLVQVKSKFGELCFYANVPDEVCTEIRALIKQAEIDCYKATHS